ncbi:DUF6082 family protein [Streptomyces parvulus]
MKLHIATALAMTTVGAAHLVLRERQHWQRNEIAVTRNQLDWLTHLTTHPELAVLWKPADLAVEEYIKLLHVNQQICQLSLRHRLGLLRGRRLRFCADEVMRREYGQRYWARYGSLREAESDGDGLAGDFTGVMNAAYARAVRTTPGTE